MVFPSHDKRWCFPVTIYDEEVEDDYDEEDEPEKEATNKKAEEPKEERNTIVHGVVDGLGRYFNAQKKN